MSVQDAKLPDTASLLEVAENAVHSAESQIESCAAEIRDLGQNARTISTETLSVLFSTGSQDELERRKREVLEQYSSILCDFSSNMYEPLALLNRAWMDVDSR